MQGHTRSGALPREVLRKEIADRLPPGPFRDHRRRILRVPMTDIYVDGDACPVREEVYRVAARLRLNVFVVSNGSRPIRPPGTSNVRMVLVGDSADAADDWIAEHISAVDVCVTSDIPLASRCLKKGARVVSSTGKQWTQANIGNALAGRELARHLREIGTNTRGPAPLTKRDRSQFVSALDTALQAALREATQG